VDDVDAILLARVEGGTTTIEKRRRVRPDIAGPEPATASRLGAQFWRSRCYPSAQLFPGRRALVSFLVLPFLAALLSVALEQYRRLHSNTQIAIVGESVKDHSNSFRPLQMAKARPTLDHPGVVISRVHGVRCTSSMTILCGRR